MTTDNFIVEERVLDGTQQGPISLNVELGTQPGRVRIDETLLGGEGGNIQIEISEAVEITDLQDLVELLAELTALEIQVRNAVDGALIAAANARQVIEDLEASIVSVQTLVDRAEQAASSATNSASASQTSADDSAASATSAAQSLTLATNRASAAEVSRAAAVVAAAQALVSRNAASASATSASNSETAAATSESNAAASETAAATSRTNAATSEFNADISEANAANSATSANLARQASQAAQAAAETAETNAETAETNAETAETNAAASASTATSQASTATTQAGIATTQATNSRNSATAAQTAQTNAETAETNAQASATAAQTAETNAETAQTGSLAAQVASEAARDRAILAEQRATASQAAALASQQAASQSATSASASSTAAQASRVAAQTAETNAETAETNAENSELAASNSASLAATRASTATTQATRATNSATASESSRQAADASRDRAIQAETNAGNSETVATEQAAIATTGANTATSQAATATTAANTATTQAGIATTQADDAADSATQAAASLAELRAGQVYRGVWNPDSGAYPDPDGTNSIWDVVVLAASNSVSFGGFTWSSGDRLLYVLATTSFEQIETGAAVTSVNGDTGAVTITADDLGAFSPSNLPSWAQVTGKPNVAIQNTAATFTTARFSNNLTIGNGSAGGARGIEWDTQGTQSGYLRATHLDGSSGPGGNYSFHFGSSENVKNVIIDGTGGFFEAGSRVYSPNNRPTPAALGLRTNTQNDARFLGINATANDSDELGGLGRTGFQELQSASIPSPLGGQFRTSEATHDGAIAINLPISRFRNNTMLSFTVNIYNYETASSIQLRVGGYNNTSGWVNTSAYLISGNRDVLIRFGRTSNREVVYIGSNSQRWRYPQISITDLVVGYTGGLSTAWRSGWSINTRVTAPEGVEFTTTAGEIYTSQNRPSLSALGALGATATATNSSQLEGRSLAQVISDARASVEAAATGYTKAEADGRFLRLTGGTLSGDLTIRTSGAATLRVDSGTNFNSEIRLSEANRVHGAYIRYNGSESSNTTVFGTTTGSTDTTFMTIGRGSRNVTFAGVLLTAAAQGSGGNALTRRDFVQGLVNAKFNTSGGTVAGSVLIQPGDTIGGNNVTGAPLVVGGSLGLDGNEIYSSSDLILGTTNTNVLTRVNSTNITTANTTGLDVTTGTLREGGDRVYSPNNIPSQHVILRRNSVTKSIRTSTSWQTLLGRGDFPQGTGLYQIWVSYSSQTDANGVAFNENYAGTLMWYHEGTNSSDVSEIPLHHMGHADNDELIFLRTQTRTGNRNNQTVDIKCTNNHAANVTYTVRVSRII